MSSTYNAALLGGRKKGRPYRRPYQTKKRKGYAGGRRAGYTKPSWNVSKRSAAIMGNVAFAKLYLKIPTYKINIPGGTVGDPGKVSFSVLCNSIGPKENDAIAAPPTPNIGQETINVGTFLLQGLQQYTPFFYKYYILGCTVTCVITSDPILQVTPGNNVDSPVQCSAGAFKLDNAGGLNPVILDNLSDTETINQKGMIHRTIANSGGANQAILKLRRSTKKVCGITDVKDNVAYSGTLDPTNRNSVMKAPVEQWFDYFKFQNTSSQAQTCNISWTIQSNICFTDRRLWIVGQSVLPSPPPSS